MDETTRQTRKASYDAVLPKCCFTPACCRSGIVRRSLR